MGEKPTGVEQEPATVAMKDQGPIEGAGETLAPDAGRTAAAVNTTRSNIKSNPST